MFERLKVDDANQAKDVAVEITLADDQVVAGNSRSLLIHWPDMVSVSTRPAAEI